MNELSDMRNERYNLINVFYDESFSLNVNFLEIIEPSIHDKKRSPSRLKFSTSK